MKNEGAARHHPQRVRGCAPSIALSLFASLSVLGLSLPAGAADLIVANVDSGQRAELVQRPPRWATAPNDRGAVPATLPLSKLTLVLNRSPEKLKAFDQFLADQQNPTSLDYHHWLTPDEIGERFGPSTHDLDVLSEWLDAQGLRVESVSNSRTRMTFGGDADKVAATFGTSLHYFQDGTKQRIAITSQPTIPTALADAIRSVAGLSKAAFKATHHLGLPREMLVHAGAPRPTGTYCIGSSCMYSVFPADFAKIYDLGPVQQQGIDGTGQTIAIVGRQRVYNPDIQNFQSLSGLATKYPTVIVPPDGIDPGQPATTCSQTGTPSCTNPSAAVNEQSEATLDVERAGSVAPGATINLVISASSGQLDGTQIATEYVIDHPGSIRILSISFTSCEHQNSQALANYLDDQFSQGQMEGISVFVASGDSGVAGCADGAAPAAGDANDSYVSPNVLCASSHVTCVGGTDFADTTDPDLYWSRTEGADFESALAYIPEGAWNEPLDQDGNPQYAVTGGGVSGYIPKPSWQIGPGVPGTRGRYTPDVSFSASTRDAYFSCLSALNGPCTVGTDGGFNFIPVGGTSAAAPSMAGIAALLNQKTGSAQANLNPRLYDLAANPANGVFHDVTVASSGVTACVLATPSSCNSTTPGPDGLSGGVAGFMVGAGYDEATGLGSIDVANLLAQWSIAQPASVDLDQRGLTGAWYNPDTTGQGINLEFDPDFYGIGTGLIFGGWFTYDTTTAGGQRWYTIQGQAGANDPYAGMPIYATEGGRFASSLATTTTPVGDATIQFSDCTHGVLAYRFSDGSQRQGTIPLSRLSPNVTCTPSGDSNVPGGDFWLSGLWADNSDSGQGILFDINPIQPVLFGAWYTYTNDGEQDSGPSSQRWYTLQAAFAPGTTSGDNIPIYDTSGGVFDRPAPVMTVPVGHVNIAFHSCSAATLNYTFTSGENAGAQGSLELTRLGPVAPGCHL